MAFSLIVPLLIGSSSNSLAFLVIILFILCDAWSLLLLFLFLLETKRGKSGKQLFDKNGPEYVQVFDRMFHAEEGAG